MSDIDMAAHNLARLARIDLSKRLSGAETSSPQRM